MNPNAAGARIVTPLRGWRRGRQIRAGRESHVSRAITIRSDKKFGRDKFNAAENSDTPSGLEARETNSRGKRVACFACNHHSFR
jgi:hypothetical protein